MADLRILINGMLDEASTTKSINKQLKEIGKSLNFNINVNDSQIEDIAKKVKKIQDQLNGLQAPSSPIKPEFDTSGIKKLEKDFNRVLDHYKQFGEVKFTKTFDPLTDQLTKFNLTVNKTDGTVEKLKYELAELAGIKGLDNLFYMKDKSIVDNSATINSQREKQLQNEEKINRQLDERRQKQAKEIADLQHTIDLYQQRAKINASGLVERYGKHVPDSQFTKYMDDLNKIPTDNIANARKEMDRLSVAYKDMAMNARIASKDTIGFGEMISTAMTKFPVTNYQAGVKLF